MDPSTNIKFLYEHKHLSIFVFIWSFIFGIFVSSIIQIRPIWSLLFFIISLGIYFSEKIWNKNVSKLVFIIILGLVAFSFGILRFDIKDFHEVDAEFEQSVGTKINLNGVVVTEPEKREKDTRFVIEVERPTFAKASEGKERILVSTDLYSEIKYGDEIRISGKLEKPGIIDSDAGRSFDYGQYLSKDDIYYTMSFAQTSIDSYNKANPIISSLLWVKGSFVAKMKSILEEPKASLLAGLLVSGKQALPKSILDEFKNAGVIHIVVLSGYNIMIVAEFFRRILSFLSLRIASSISIFGVILFVLMTGASATIVRAGIMALIAISGKMFGRSYSVSRALLVAGFMMLIQNPKILVFDPSFQLSMLATIAMIYVSPVVDKYLTKITERWGMRQILSATISTQIFVLPFLLYSMGSVSVVSLLSNILILAFVPFTMLIGFVSTTLSYVSTIISLPFTLVAHIFLSWILGVAHILGNLSWASLKISSFPIWGMVLVYVFYGVILVRLRGYVHKSANLN